MPSGVMHLSGGSSTSNTNRRDHSIIDEFSTGHHRRRAFDSQIGAFTQTTLLEGMPIQIAQVLMVM